MARQIALLALTLLLGALLGWSLAPRGGRAQEAQATSTPSAPSGASSRQARPALEAAAEVELARVEQGPLTAERQAPGVVVATTSRIPAQVGGVVAQVLKPAGSRVARGETVVLLDRTPFELALTNARTALAQAEITLRSQTRAVAEAQTRLESQLQAAQAAYRAAQSTYEATRRAFELGGASRAELENAQSALAQAQANLEAARAALAQNERAGEETLAQLRLQVEAARVQVAQAERNLALSAVRAPFAGEVVSVGVNPGEYLGAGAVAFTLAAQERWVQFSLSPADAAGLSPGTTLTFVTEGKTYPLRVEQNPKAPSGGQVTLLARFSQEAPDLPLGTTGMVRYRLTLARGLLLPVTALSVEGNATYVFQVEGGVGRQREVTVLAQSGDLAAVEGELAPGAQVVLNPPPGLLDGSRVRAASGRSSPQPVPEGR